MMRKMNNLKLILEVGNEVASKFNGGGHKFASGARLKTESEVDDLFNALDELCKIEKQKEE